jgi:hypothetical protein
VVSALAPPPPSGGSQPRARILHLVRGWPPLGDHHTANEVHFLARSQAASLEVLVYASASESWPAWESGDALEHRDGGVRVRLIAGARRGASWLARRASERRLRRDFRVVLREFAPHLVHVHDLDRVHAALARVVARAGIPLVYQALGGGGGSALRLPPGELAPDRSADSWRANGSARDFGTTYAALLAASRESR